MQIGIIGLGLIGGSLALDLKNQMNTRLVGCDMKKEHESAALELGLVHEILPEAELISSSKIIVCCIPVDMLELKLPEILDQLKPDQVLIDTGSTKKMICEAVHGHAMRSRFVAAHPLAGTEHSGPKAAIQSLFRTKKNIICEAEKSDKDAIEIAQQLFLSVGMESYFLNALEHDRHMAYVSHLSHVSSFMLGLTVLDLEKDENQIANLASTGFESTARLAKSSPKTWAAIFEKNSEYLVEAMESYISYLNEFLSIIKNNNHQKSIEMMQEANEVKRILDGIKRIN